MAHHNKQLQGNDRVFIQDRRKELKRKLILLADGRIQIGKIASPNVPNWYYSDCGRPISPNQIAEIQDLPPGPDTFPNWQPAPPAYDLSLLWDQGCKTCFIGALIDRNNLAIAAGWVLSGFQNKALACGIILLEFNLYHNRFSHFIEL
jgi:hypothetical protein